MKAFQYVYGKLTKSLEGPILKGSDHACTGLSAGLPDSVGRYCQPVKIGPGINDLTPWQEYSWKEGGYAFQTVFDGEKPWVVACKVRGRSESGEGKPGRIYQQAHYLALPADAFQRTGMKALWQACDPLPMQSKDMSLPHVGVSSTSHDLPADWLEQDAPYIRALMSGQSIRLQQVKVEIDDLMTRFQRILCALPADIAWRIGLRLGAWEMRDEVALAHGQRAMSGIRFIGKNLKGDNGIDYQMGDRYLDFLRKKCHTAKTDHELAALVRDNCSVETQIGTYPANQPWAKLAVELVQRMFEKDALQTMLESIQQGTDLPLPGIFQFYRDQALKLAMTDLNGKGGEFLLGCLSSDWSDAWYSFDKGSLSLGRAVGLALGQIDLLTAQDMADIADCVLPDTLVAVASESLDNGLLKDFGGAVSSVMIWEVAFQKGHQDWFEKWAASAVFRLFWLSLDFLQRGESRLFAAGQGLRPWMLLEQAIHADEGWVNALDELLQQTMSGRNADRNQNGLFYKMLLNRPTRSVVLLPVSKETQWTILTELNGPFAHELSEFESISKQILAEIQEPHPFLVRLLVLATVSGVLKPEQTKSTLVSHLGSAANGILFNMEPTSDGAHSVVAEKAIIDGLVAGFVQPKRFIETFPNSKEGLRSAIDLAFVHEKALNPALQALVELKFGSSPRPATLSADDLDALDIWVEHCSPFPKMAIPNDLSPPLLLKCLPLLGSCDLSAWIEQNALELWLDSGSWSTKLKENRLNKKQYWRLKMALETEPTQLIQVSENEERLIYKLDHQDAFQFLLSGVLLKDVAYSSILRSHEELKPQTLSQAKALCAASLTFDGSDNALPAVMLVKSILRWAPEGNALLKEREPSGFFGKLWNSAVAVMGDKSSDIWKSSSKAELLAAYVDALSDDVLERLKA